MADSPHGRHRLERSVDQLRTEVDDLAAEVRLLQDALVALQAEARPGSGGPPEASLDELQPPTAAGGQSVVRRLSAAAARRLVRFARRLRTVTGPEQDGLRWLRLVRGSAPRPLADVVLCGEDDPGDETVVLDLRAGGRDHGLEEDLAFAFAALPLRSVWSVDGAGLPAFRAVRGPADPFEAFKPGSGAPSYGIEVGGGEQWPDAENSLARRLPDRHGVWHCGPWRVVATERTRAFEIPVHAVGGQAPGCEDGVLVLLGEALELGLEDRVAPVVLDLLDREVPVVVAACAAMSPVGEQRLAALSRSGARVARVARLLPPQVWPDRIRAVARGARRLWVVGGAGGLAPLVDAARAGAAEVCEVVAESGFDPGVSGASVPPVSPWPLTIPTSLFESDARAETSGAPTVLVAGDWVPAGRPEDAVLLARELAGEARVRLAGSGPLEVVVRDLARVLESDLRVEPRPRSDGSGAGVDVVCWPGEGPWLPPSVTSAIQAGVPVAMAGTGLAVEVAEELPDAVHLGGVPGDVASLAEAVRRALAAGPPPADAAEALAGRVSRERSRMLELLAP